MTPETLPIRLVCLAALLGPSAVARTVGNEPEAGVSLAVWQTAPLLQELPRPCIAWHHEGASLLVPRGALEALMTARPSRWESEEERQALMGRLCGGASASGGRPSWRNAAAEHCRVSGCAISVIAAASSSTTGRSSSTSPVEISP